MINQSLTNEERDVSGFVFYESYFKAIERLKPRQKLLAYTAIMEYAFTGKMPELDGAAGSLLMVILPNIKNCKQRYVKKVERSRKYSVEKQKSEAVAVQEELSEDDDMSNLKPAKKTAAGDIIIKDNTNTSTNTSTDTSTSSKKTSRKSADCASPDLKNTHAPETQSCYDIISDYACGDSELCSLLNDWLSIRKERGQPINSATISLNLQELTRITEGQDKKAYLREVVRRGWGTFFKLEKNGCGTSFGERSSGKNRRDEGMFGESSFDLDEFDAFTLGLTRPSPD